MWYIMAMERTDTPEIKEKSGSQSFWELVRFALIALIIVVPIRVLVAEPFVVSGSSMAPTFKDGDYLIVDKLSYRLANPHRDDVVIFRFPGDPSKFYIKRIIGLPSETVIIDGGKITIINEAHPDGLVLDQPFIEKPSSNNLRFDLKADEYFVMGDNRNASSDSRFWGPVKRDLLSGRALLRLLPINKIETLPGDYNQTE